MFPMNHLAREFNSRANLTSGTVGLWDCGTVVLLYCGTVVRLKSSTTVPLEFTCISIQVVLWYCGTLQKTHPK